MGVLVGVEVGPPGVNVLVAVKVMGLVGVKDGVQVSVEVGLYRCSRWGRGKGGS